MQPTGKLMLTFMLLVSTFAWQPMGSLARAADSDEFILEYEGKLDEENLQDYGVEIVDVFPTLGLASIIVEKSAITSLVNEQGIVGIYENKDVQLQGSQQVSWSFNKIEQPIMEQGGQTGKGVQIAVLDTGIDTNHPDLIVKGGMCALNNCDSYDDDNGHGTHVAGIIGAEDNDIGVKGVAPDADIFAVKVLDEIGEGSSSSILSGINWAIDNDMDIINLSLTTSGKDTALQRGLAKAYEAGLLIVGASGNKGDVVGGSDVAYPGQFDSVIAVGGIQDNLVRMSSSSYGPSLEVVAPGSNIYSTVPTELGNGYAYMSGTSMAAPHVSGMLALYMEKIPNATNKELRTLLQQNTLDLGRLGRDDEYGYGLVQALETDLQEDDSTVSLISTANGKVEFLIGEEGQKEYTIYRNGEEVVRSTNTSFLDYVLAGEYMYEFSVEGGDGVTKTYTRNVNVLEPNFTDLTMGKWFTPNMIYLYNESILTGFDQYSMKPGQIVTRGQAVAMIGRALGLDGQKRATSFADVGSQYFASGYIQEAVGENIVTGFPDGSFRPNDKVTRAEMAILLAKAYELAEPTETSSFKDVNGITAEKNIYQIAEAGITQGYEDNTFQPFLPMTRAQFSVFLSRAENENFQ
ncbi:S8 family peptidase [Bacillus fonticola]|uniref:S8 family peptidase n=1 Tax=Bacillus fonticola TaxID=2728853 RepID=UPI0014730255|nr:S8 family serine peptidase [Bacillus fonticola]